MPRIRPAAVLAALVIVSFTGCAASRAVSAPTSAVTGDPQVAVVDLAVGNCLDTHGRPSITATVPVVDCDLEHDSEAYAQVVLDEGDFPGDAAVKAAAEQGCSDDFSAFVGLDYASSALDYAYYFPTQGSWATGDRRILCLVGDPDARVTGTLDGAAR
jgi:hypothetical protein